MPPYESLEVESLVFMFGVGLILVFGIILARGSRWFSFTMLSRPDQELEKVHHFGGEVSEDDRPVPWLIWVVLFGYFAWAIGYVIYAGRHGV